MSERLAKLRRAIALHGRMVVFFDGARRLSWCPAESPRGRALTEQMPPSVLGVFGPGVTANQLSEALQ